jgi:hypothetical protein
MTHTAPAAPSRISKGAMRKFGIIFQWIFFTVIFHFQLEDPRMNDPRAFENSEKSVLPTLAKAQQCLAALHRERGNSVQPMKMESRHKCSLQTIIRLWQRRNKFSSPTSQLVSKLEIKKQGGALKLLWSLRGWEEGKNCWKSPRLSL